jgi:hypothetical protein
LERPAPEAGREKPRLPPRWFVRAAWIVHRAIYRLTGGRRGLWLPKSGSWGAMRLTTIGRIRAQGGRGADLDAYAIYRPGGTAVVVFEPRRG